VKVALWKTPGVTVGEQLETDADGWWKNAQANADGFRKAKIETVVVLNPHDYTLMIKEYPKKVDTSGYQVIFVTDYLADLLAKKGAGRLKPVDKVVSYHDPCTINKQCGLNKSPRAILNAIPGLTFKDESPVTQWSYCCGNGMASFKQLHPDIAYRIGQTKNVFVYKLVTRGTIEERIDILLEEKRALAESVIGGGFLEEVDRKGLRAFFALDEAEK